jgi:hypothetical protein
LVGRGTNEPGVRGPRPACTARSRQHTVAYDPAVAGGPAILACSDSAPRCLAAAGLYRVSRQPPPPTYQRACLICAKVYAMVCAQVLRPADCQHSPACACLLPMSQLSAYTCICLERASQPKSHLWELTPRENSFKRGCEAAESARLVKRWHGTRPRRGDGRTEGGRGCKQRGARRAHGGRRASGPGHNKKDLQG